MNNVQAYLIAYPAPGETMEFRTYNFEEVHKFKQTCKEHGIPFSVHFRQPPADRSAYIQNKSLLVRTINTIKKCLTSPIF